MEQKEAVMVLFDREEEYASHGNEQPDGDFSS
jgi:hypothetical protein